MFQDSNQQPADEMAREIKQPQGKDQNNKRGGLEGAGGSMKGGLAIGQMMGGQGDLVRPTREDPAVYVDNNDINKESREIRAHEAFERARKEKQLGRFDQEQFKSEKQASLLGEAHHQKGSDLSMNPNSGAENKVKNLGRNPEWGHHVPTSTTQ